MARLLGAALAVFLGVAPLAAAAQETAPVPEARDLLLLAASAERAHDTAADCRNSYCPEVDCRLTADLAGVLVRAGATLTAMQPWLDRARSAAVEHYRVQMAELLRHAERRNQLELALAWQESLQTFARMLLDIASIVDWAEETSRAVAAATDPTSGWPATLVALDQADGAVEAVGNALSLADSLSKQLVEGGLGVPPAAQSVLDMKNLASEAKNLLLRSREAAALAKRAAISGDALATAAARQASLRSLRSLGQIVGRIGLLAIDAQKAGVNDEIAELLKIEADEAASAANAFADWQRWARLSEAAFLALEAIGDPMARFAACLASCPGPILEPLNPPEFAGYGVALAYYKVEIAKLATALDSGLARFQVARATPPQLTLERRAYHPGERVTAHILVAECAAPEATVAMVDGAGAERGYSRLNGLVEGYADFIAPEPGDYSIDLTTGAGQSLARVDFAVLDPDQELPPPGAFSPPAFPPPPEPLTPPPAPETAAPATSTPSTAADGEVCGAINCDCANVEAGLLTGVWQDECLIWEQKLIQQCLATGVIDGSCGLAPAGPAATPP